MYVLENTKSVGLAIVGRGIVMDNDKYCEYSFGGFGKGMELSSIIDCTETKGYVYNVKIRRIMRDYLLEVQLI